MHLAATYIYSSVVAKTHHYFQINTYAPILDIRPDCGYIAGVF